jgi:signal transduction histidine kinase
MMRKITTAIVVAILGLMSVALTATAGSYGTAEEAKVMVAKAAELLTSEGGEKAYAAFADPSAGFIDRDLYVFVIDMAGTVVANGANKTLVGKSIVTLKDSSGKAFIEAMIEVAKTSGEGWVDYNWPNPTTKKIEPKSSFVRKVGDVLVGVGIYKG